MGEVEKNAGKKIRRRKIQEGLLAVLYATAGLTLILTAPNAARLLNTIDPDFLKKRSPSRRMKQAFERLLVRGLVKRTKKFDGSWEIKLTEKGKVHARKLHKAAALVVRKPKKWDSRWRIVIFDVNEHRRSARDQLRTFLKKIGFVAVQKSVWAYPYSCEELLTFIKTELKLGTNVLYFVAEGVENDQQLRKHFAL